MSKTWNLAPASLKERKTQTKGEASRRGRYVGPVVCPKCGEAGYLCEDSRYRDGVLVNTYLYVQHREEGHYVRACYLGVKGEVHI